jgi:glyoxylate utilization-related uncharacterized protein
MHSDQNGDPSTHPHHHPPPHPPRANSNLSYLIQPSKGANFLSYLASMGKASAAPTKSPIMERFMLVIEGQIEVEVNGDEVAVGADSFAYLPPASEEFLTQT